MLSSKKEAELTRVNGGFSNRHLHRWQLIWSWDLCRTFLFVRWRDTHSSLYHTARLIDRTAENSVTTASRQRWQVY